MEDIEMSCERSAGVAEVRDFRFDTNLIYEAIIRQSDSVVGAFAELVQNSADAGATKCEVFFDEDGFTVSDNGRGFKSREEIINWFEIFGKPHDHEDHRRFGKFRMGRGQIMGYAATVWTSGQFTMEVDIKKRGLKYGLQSTSHFRDGCKITGQWYKDNDRSVLFRGHCILQDETIDSIHLSLSKKLRYIYGMDVFINGVLANDFHGAQWLYEDDVFCFARPEDDEIYYFDNKVKFYNLGIYIDSLPIHRTTGSVVTKRALSVNLTRTKIQDSCKVLAHIKSKLRLLIPKYSQSKKYQSWEAKDILQGLLTRDVSYQDVCKLSMFQNIRGTKHHCLEDLSANRFVIAPPGKQFEVIADQIHAQGLCIVLKSDSDHRFYITSKPNKVTFAEAFYLIFRNEVSESHNIQKNMLDFDAVCKQLDIEKTELKTEEQAMLVQLKLKAFNLCRYDISKEFRSGKRTREFFVGLSSSALAWTDCKTKIVFELSHLNELDKGYPAAIQLLQTIAHEYSHVADDVLHDGDFFEKYHDMTIRADLFKLASQVLRKYDDLLAKEGLAPSVSMEKAMRVARRDGKAKSAG